MHNHSTSETNTFSYDCSNIFMKIHICGEINHFNLTILLLFKYLVLEKQSQDRNLTSKYLIFAEINQTFN